MPPIVLENDMKPEFDWAFVGMGAGTGILLHQLHQRGLLEGKSIAILEPQSKTSDDKTYCFWAAESDEVMQIFDHLISNSWESVIIDDGHAESILPKKYHRIRSLDLYLATREIVNQVQGHFYPVELAEPAPSETNASGFFDLGLSNGQTICARQVFDSRPPQFAPETQADVLLVQSFVGYRVQLTSEDHEWDEKAFHMMDFHVDQGQGGEVQFMYVLPEGPRTGLVELTRFGEACLPLEEAQPVLQKYIHDRLGPFEIVETETGRIPMCKAPMAHHSLPQHPQWTPIGTRAGCVKPSTGYAFKSMLVHAHRICDQLEGRTPLSPSAPPPGNPRFAFYDHLLLLILRDRPALGKPIFQRLFKVKPARFILEFLDESTSLWGEVSMFAQLPKGPFLKAWWKRIQFAKRTPWISTAAWFSVVLLYHMVNVCFLPQTSEWAMNGIMLMGLMAVGIPHGALDAVTEMEVGGESPLRFYARYLGIMIAVLGLWWWTPTAALMLFLVASAWHFGQADGLMWSGGQASPAVNWAWGILLLGFILGTHVDETLRILEPLGVRIQVLEVVGQNTDAIHVVIWSLWFMGLLLSGLKRHVLALMTIVTLGFSATMPLLLAFGSYFVFHHSLNGWQHLRHGTGWSDGKLWRRGAPFTIGAFAFMAGAIALFMAWDQSFHRGVGAFFAALSALSLPHIWSSHAFLKSR